MKFNKRGQKILVEIVLILVFAFIFWHVLNFGIKKTAEAAINPLKKMLGLEPKADLEKQKEIASKDMLKNADDVYTKFKAMATNCMSNNVEDRFCLCDTVDFTKLNNYYLKLSNSEGKQDLELIDSKSSPVVGKRDTLGNFYIGPIDITSSTRNYGYQKDYQNLDAISNRIREFNKNLQYITFTQEKTAINKGKGTDLEKSNGKMNKINFIKVTKDTITIDENDYGLRRCGLPIDCLKRFAYYYPKLSESQEYGEQTTGSFEICKNMEPNNCYRYNPQYIQFPDRCKDQKINPSASGCSIDFQVDYDNDKSINYAEIRKVLVKKGAIAPEAFRNFKLVYDFKEAFNSKEVANRINTLISELNNKGLNVKINFIDSLKPFDSLENNGVSTFTNQMFNNQYDKNGLTLVIADDDGRIEMIFGDNAKQALKMDETQCKQILGKFKQEQITIAEKLQNLLYDLQKESSKSAEEFLNSLLKGYQACLEKKYSDKTISGIIGACNCGTKVKLSDLKNFKIELKVEQINQPQNQWRTIFTLKDSGNNVVMIGDIYQLFGPCKRVSSDVFNPPSLCAAQVFNSDTVKAYSINGELWLAKGKVQGNQGITEEIFFGDKSLPECPA